MRLALLSDSETGVNIFTELRDRLSVDLPELKIETSYVPFRTDLPMGALELSKKNDLIFVFSLYEEETPQINAIIGKLIDVEISSGKRIIKAVQESEFEEIIDKTDLDSAKTEIAVKWASFIVKLIDNPETFSTEPKKADMFSGDEERFSGDEKRFSGDEERFSE